jgi:sterol desaturase/sphingolipid hydroxylase (fatty acid hydroxylase superfamily)
MFINYVFSPLLWPLNNIIQALFVRNASDDSAVLEDRAPPYLDIMTHISVVYGALRAIILAYAVIYWLPSSMHGATGYPAFGGAETFSTAWIMPIVIRNIVATWLICGFWDWFLYFGPLKEMLRQYKMNPIYPSIDQINHDAFWTSTASIVAALLEACCCYAYCNNIFPAYSLDWTWHNILWALLLTHWRVPHFYLVHRVMHPWHTTTVPDIGKVLYKHVHSLHHKSYNPTAFSGTSMHPIESLLYYSACLIPVPFGCHPLIVLACLIDCAVGAWLGHDGFQFPGSGDMFHQLHHAHFDCNYGTSIVPIDYWFGTSVSCKEDLKYISWKKKI